MREERTQKLGSLLALLLLGVFAVCILAVLLTGANDYGKLVQRDSAAFDRRTAAQYLTTKLRQADAAGAVRVGTFEDGLPPSGATPAEGDTLYLTETLEGTLYCTRIYCQDGYLREQFSEAAAPLAPEDGEKILPAERLRLTRASADGPITAELTDAAGETTQLVLALRSGEGAAA